MLVLNLASCMAENSEILCRDVASLIESELAIPTQYVAGIPWQERERMFDRGEIQILWLCGLPYADKADLALSNIELLAAPVPSGERYRGQPVYYSDVIVRSDSSFRDFLDLLGASWAYNEPRSHSGFNVVRSYLADIGAGNSFFRTIVESGAHSTSFDMILTGAVDCAAIDSTVLDWLIARRPEAASRIRTIATLGPSPIPPWVTSMRLPASLRAELRALLLCLHMEPRGNAMLARSGYDRFVAAEDRDYDPIRRMARKAAQVSLI